MSTGEREHTTQRPQVWEKVIIYNTGIKLWHVGQSWATKVNINLVKTLNG